MTVFATSGSERKGYGRNYSETLEQTFKFPLSRPVDLAVQAEANLQAVRRVAVRLGVQDARATDPQGPVWTNVAADIVLSFLREYRMDEEARNMSIPLICDYIERLTSCGELVRWIIAVRGRASLDPRLRSVDWGLPTGLVFQISRSRLKAADSVGVIVDPEDEAIGLDTEERSIKARKLRPAEEGLLLLYPISRYSGSGAKESRKPLYEDPEDPLARDLVGLAISFPTSRQVFPSETYVEGTVGWRL